MGEFIPVATVSGFPESRKLCLEIDDRFIVLVHVDGKFYCLDDVCTHDGGPLGEGELEGKCLVCPRHGAKFDVTNGEAVLMPATEATASHEVRVVGDSILVRIAE
ncbi:MAG: Rieske 2Fe-2S domain-containing protein [Planctomycetales bacterium]|nr:Rieske 2Fe-2S domain-containing protein [Planctomycetales bacterium]